MLSGEQIKNQQQEQLSKLIEWVGTRARLANELGESKQTVYFWVKRGRISARAAVLVEKKTQGLFKKEDLRPDVIKWSNTDDE